LASVSVVVIGGALPRFDHMKEQDKQLIALQMEAIDS